MASGLLDSEQHVKHGQNEKKVWKHHHERGGRVSTQADSTLANNEYSLIKVPYHVRFTLLMFLTDIICL